MHTHKYIHKQAWMCSQKQKYRFEVRFMAFLFLSFVPQEIQSGDHYKALLGWKVSRWTCVCVYYVCVFFLGGGCPECFLLRCCPHQ